MRTPFSTVMPGQRLQFSATEHNAFIRTALRAEDGQIPGEERLRPRPPRIVNRTSTPVVKGDVVRVAAEVRDGEDAAPVNDGNYLLESLFSLAIPEADDALNSVYAIALDSMLENQSAPCAIGEVAVATVDVQDLTHRYARPNGQQLRSTSDPMSPYIILGTPPSLDVLDLNVWQKGISTVVRKATVTEALGITAGSFGTVTIDYDGAAEQWLGADHTVEAYHDWILGEDISTGLNCFICYFPEDDKWRIIGVECEPEPAPAPPGHGDRITASTTQTQAGAQSLGYAVNRVTICANDNDAVKLPDAAVGDRCYIMNDTDNILQAFPTTDNKFTRQAEDVSVYIPVRTGVEFQGVNANVWSDPRGHDVAARWFDGSADFIQLGSGSIPNTWTSNTFTLFFECIEPCTTNNDYIFNHGGGSGRWRIWINASGKLEIGTGTGGVIPDDVAMAAGRYLIQHDTGETGFDRWKVWIDGASATNTTTGTHTNIGASTNNFEVGRVTGGGSYADMVLRDIRWWNGLASWADMEGEVTTNLGLWWHLNDASGVSTARDVSGSSRDGTYTGTTRIVPW